MKPLKKQKKTSASTLSTRTPDNGIGLNEKPPQESPIAWSFHTLPLSVFFRQIDDGTVDEDIYNEFFDAIKDREGRYIKKLIKEINLLQVKFSLCQAGIVYMELTDERDEDIMKVLAKYLAIRPVDTLKIILTRSRKLLSDIDFKQKELTRISPKGDGTKVDRKYFSHLIVQVQKHLKITIIKKETVVGEFAEMIIDLRDEIEKQEQQQNAR